MLLSINSFLFCRLAYNRDQLIFCPKLVILFIWTCSKTRYCSNFDNIASEVIVYGNSITDNYTNTTQDDDVDNEVDVEDDNDDFYDEVMSRIGEKPIAAVIEEMCRSGHTVNMFFVIS